MKRREKGIIKDGKKLCRQCMSFKSLSKFRLQYYKNLDKNYYVSPCCDCNIIQRKKKYWNHIRGLMWLPEKQIIRYRASAKRRKLSFDVDLDFFRWVNKKPCYYCGGIPKDGEATGIDRVINDLGYSKENCVPCCAKCNTTKFQMSENEFVNHCRKIIEYQDSKTIQHFAG